MPARRTLGPWTVFLASEIVRCPGCGKAFGEVQHHVEALVRVRPEALDGERAQLSRRCDRCGAMLEVVMRYAPSND